MVPLKPRVIDTQRHFLETNKMAKYMESLLHIETLHEDQLNAREYSSLLDRGT